MFEVVINKIVSLVGRIVTTGRKERIKSNSKGILNQSRHNSLHKIAIDLQTRVIVSLYKIRLEIPINHEIQPNKLKVIPIPPLINPQIISHQHIHPNILHLPQNIPLKTNLPLIVVIQIPLKLTVRYLVPLLVFLVVIASLLDCVVCQVNIYVVC